MRNLFITILCSITCCVPAFSQTAETYYQDGFFKFVEGDYPRALKAFDTSIAMHTNNAMAYFYRGALRYKLQDYKGAISDEDRAIQLNSQLAGSYMVRGNAKKELMQYQDALNDFNKVIAFQPGERMAYYQRSFVRNKLNDKDGARADRVKANDVGLKDTYDKIDEREPD